MQCTINTKATNTATACREDDSLRTSNVERQRTGWRERLIDTLFMLLYTLCLHACTSPACFPEGGIGKWRRKNLFLLLFLSVFGGEGVSRREKRTWQFQCVQLCKMKPTAIPAHFRIKPKSSLPTPMGAIFLTQC